MIQFFDIYEEKKQSIFELLLIEFLLFENSIQQILEGNKSIVGMMLESHLSGGNQPLPSNLEELKYGVSVTDQCIDWEETERLILAAYANLSKKSV